MGYSYSIDPETQAVFDVLTHRMHSDRSSEIQSFIREFNEKHKGLLTSEDKRWIKEQLEGITVKQR